MSIEEQRRKAFEEWYVQDCLHEAAIVITVDEIAGLRGKYGDYRERAALHGKWVGWNAALDSVCVELPESFRGDDGATGVYDVFDAEEARKAIHAAGIKTK